MLEREEFNRLAAMVSEPSVSIYMPSHEAGVAVNEGQDLIVFKNLIGDAIQMLKNKGLADQKANQFMQQATTLLKDEELWLQLEKGLVVFISSQYFKVLKVPIPVQAEVHVNSKFYLTPLVCLFTDVEHFFLLNLSKHAAKFYRGDRFGLKILDIEGLPQGMDDVIHFEEKSERKLFRGGGTAPGAAANYHGHGNGLSDEKEYITQYLREVDQTLWTEILSQESAPLILAGVEYIVGIFRQITHYKHLVEPALTGSYEHMELHQLRDKVKDLVAPYLKEKNKKALKNYYNQLATPLTSSMPEKVIPASYYKQVSDLFVEKDAHIWGSFDEEANKLVVNEQRQMDDECLINRAIINTLINGGDVYVLEKERMPNRALIAASLRF